MWLAEIGPEGMSVHEHVYVILDQYAHLLLLMLFNREVGPQLFHKS